MKVLHIGKYYPPHMGGIETHLQTLCSELIRTIDVSVLVANSGPDRTSERIDGVSVTRVGTPMHIASAPVCPGMLAQIRNTDADLVHVHLPNPTAVLAYLASGHHGPLVVTYHSDTVRQRILGTLFEPYLHRFMRRAQAILVTSPNYLSSSPVLRRYKERCHVVPYGIPLTQFASCEPSRVAEIRRKHGGRLLLAVGRLVYYKGFEYLIEAMKSIDGKLMLIGDGPLLGSLRDLAAARGVSDRIVFLGTIQNNDVVPYYHAASLFVLPSVARSEAFGIVQIEAMAAGSPVVNTSLDSGVPFVSLHNLTGLTVPPADPVALAEAINTLLDNDHLRARLGSAARERANAMFSAETMAKRTLETYHSIQCGDHPGATSGELVHTERQPHW